MVHTVGIFSLYIYPVHMLSNCACLFKNEVGSRHWTCLPPVHTKMTMGSVTVGSLPLANNVYWYCRLGMNLLQSSKAEVEN